MLVSFPNSDIVESPSDVEFQEDMTFGEAIQDFMDERQRVGILHSDLIQLPVVNNGPEFVPFISKEQRGHVQGVTGTNATQSQVFINPVLESWEVGLWHQV